MHCVKTVPILAERDNYYTLIILMGKIFFFFAVNDGCLEFHEGFCGWANSNRGVLPWRQVMKQETERSTNQVNSYLRKKGWKLLPGSVLLNFYTNRT